MNISKYTFEITKYSLQRQRARNMTIPVNYVYVTIKCVGYINCYGSNQQKIFIYFVPSEATLPNNGTNLDKKYGWIFLRPEEYPPLVDLLRNEKPVYGHIFTDVEIRNYISTGTEPTGEEESE